MAKKLLSAFIAAIMVLALVPMSVFAKSGEAAPATRDPAIYYEPVTTIEDSAANGFIYLVGYNYNGTIYLIMSKKDDGTSNNPSYYANVSGDYYMYGVEAVMDGNNVVGVKNDVYELASLARTEMMFNETSTGFQIQSCFETGRYMQASTSYHDTYFGTSSSYYNKWAVSGDQLIFSGTRYMKFWPNESGTYNNLFACYTDNDEYTHLLFFRKVMPAPTTITVSDFSVQATLTATPGTDYTVTFDPDTDVDKRVTYSIAPTSVATVDANTGVVTGVAAGTATLTVTSVKDPSVFGTATVTVEGAVMPQGINVDQNVVEITKGETSQIAWEVIPSNVTNNAVTFSSSNTAAATVSNSGLITGVGDGTAVITVASVADSNVTAEVNVTVHGPAITYDFDGTDPVDGWLFENNDGNPLEWTVGKDSAAAHSGDKYLYIDTYNSDSYNVGEDNWAFTPPITVGADSKVVFYYKNPRNSYDSTRDHLTVYVGTDVTSAGMIANGTVILDVTTIPGSWTKVEYDLSGFAANDYIIVAFNLQLVGSNSWGYGAAIDDVEFWGSAAEYHAEPETIDVDNIDLILGQETDVVYQVNPALASQDVTFASSDENVFTVDASGHVVSVGVGTATLTVTSTVITKVKGTATVKVTNEIYPTAVDAGPDININFGGTAQITCSFTPSDANMTTLTYASSNPAVATVDSTGLVTGIFGGTAVITVTNTDTGLTDTVTVTVTADSYFWDFETDPAGWGWSFINNGGTSYNWEWHSSGNDTHATSGVGVIYHHYESNSDDFALLPGPISIGSLGAVMSFYASVYSASYPETFSVWVGSTNDVTAMTMVGQEYTITNLTPELFEFVLDAYAGQEVYIAIRYTSNDMYYLYVDDVTIANRAAPQSISVPATLTVKETLTVELPVSVLPANASQEVTVVSADTAKAEVLYDTDTGVWSIKGVSAGTVDITVTSVADTSVYAICTVTVEAAVYPDEITGIPATLNIDGRDSTTYQLVWDVLPADADNKNVLFASSDPVIASVDASGLITAHFNGTVTITVTCEADPTVTASVEVTCSKIPLPSWHFDDGVDPTTYGWQLIDYDGDTHNWFLTSSTSTDNNGNYFYQSADGFLISESYDSATNSALNSDNWAVTPAILTGADGLVVKFYMRSQDLNWPDPVQVFVGTSPDIADYLSATPDLEIAAVPSVHTQYQVVLPANSVCYVLFRHEASDCFRLILDTVDVCEVEKPTSVTVPDVTVERGLTAPLVVTFAPDGCADSYEAVVADTTIATVANGVVHGLTAGTTTVTVTSTVDPSVTTTATITVEAATIEYYFDDGNDPEGWTLDSWDLLQYPNIAHSGEYMIYSGSDGYAVTPAIFVEGTASFKFYAKKMYSADDSSFEIYIGSSSDPTTMTMIGTTTAVTGEYVGYEVDLSAYADTTIYIAIHSVLGSSSYLLVDSVQFWGDVALAPDSAAAVTVEHRGDVPTAADQKGAMVYSFQISFGDFWLDLDGTPKGHNTTDPDREITKIVYTIAVDGGATITHEATNIYSCTDEYFVLHLLINGIAYDKLDTNITVTAVVYDKYDHELFTVEKTTTYNGAGNTI